MRNTPTISTTAAPPRTRRIDNSSNLWLAKVALAALLAASVAGCASTPVFDTKNVDRSITPSAATARPADVRGKTVLWGGVIIATTNFKDHTQIEVLAYPLDSDNRPDPSGKPLGRVLIEKSGYLEPVDYAQGRLVTALGTVDGTKAGRVGKTAYTYPVLRATQVHLWTRHAQSNTQFHFGIGVIFH